MEKVNDVSEEHKVIRESTGMGIIRVALESDFRCFKILERILQLGSAAIIISGFIIGSVSPIS